MELDLEEINRPDRELLDPANIDNVARALLSLTHEVCVLTDRLAVLEQVLDDRGIDVGDAIESYQPSETLRAEIKLRTQRVINAVTGALQGR